MIHQHKHGHTASLLSDGIVLVTGGAIDDIDSTTSSESYNPTTGKWKNEDNMETDRVWHTASMLKDGNILIAVGNEAATLGNSLNTAEIYNSTMKGFTQSNSQSSRQKSMGQLT